MKYSIDFLKKAHKTSFNNSTQVKNSTICGCFYCKASYRSEEVTEWVKTKDEMTALCPRCGIDSVIGSESGYPVNEIIFLEGMNIYWF